MNAARPASGLSLALFALLAGCGASPAPVLYPGELRAVSELGADMLLRQRIVGVRGEARWELEVVLQKRGDSLLLLALTPFGTRLFAFTQEGDGEPTLETFIDVEPPFPPRFVLLDVHRVLMQSGARPPGGEGEVLYETGEERVRERWSGGALMSRRFERIDFEPPGSVSVSYGEGMREGGPPPTVELVNEWAGYRVTIHTLSRRAL